MNRCSAPIGIANHAQDIADGLVLYSCSNFFPSIHGNMQHNEQSIHARYPLHHAIHPILCTCSYQTYLPAWRTVYDFETEPFQTRAYRWECHGRCLLLKWNYRMNVSNDVCAITGQRLIDTVVNNFPNQVVKPLHAHIANVHGEGVSNDLETL